MSEPWAPRRPRPVAEVPIGRLTEAAEDVAKQWLAALMASTPLEAAASMPLATFAREAPALCAAVVRALGADHELDRLRPDGDLHALAAEAARMAGARDPAAAVAAVEALRGVLWTALMAMLVRPAPEEVAAVSERLGYVCSVLAQAVLSSPSVRARSESGPAESESGGGSQNAPAAQGPPGSSTPPEPFVEPTLEGTLSLRDTRGRAGRFERTDAASWLAAIERRLERYERDSVPFAALLIEADGIERLLVAETGREVAIAIEAVERAISEELRPADTLVRESLGRYWLLAPDTEPQGAGTLAERVAEVVGQRASHRGVPLTVSIGVVVCPDDGTDATQLADRAEERLFAARAAGQQAANAADRPG